MAYVTLCLHLKTELVIATGVYVSATFSHAEIILYRQAVASMILNIIHALGDRRSIIVMLVMYVFGVQIYDTVNSSLIIYARILSDV